MKKYKTLQVLEMSFINLFTNDTSKIKRVGYEDILVAIKTPDQYLLINTLFSSEQQVLIPTTLSFYDEENVINGLIRDGVLHKHHIIVYGKNNCDETSEKKCRQLIKLGFSNVYIYSGGMFEWCLLQDVYSNKNFPTTQPIKDLLYFRPLPQIEAKSTRLVVWNK
jgi:hypothetical protein